MKPWKHQVSITEEAYAILKKYGIVYLAMEERTGKSYIGLLLAEKARVLKTLIITKKKAFDDWAELLGKAEINKLYDLTTYTQLHKFQEIDYDLIILDEAHNYISQYPKPSKTWHEVKQITKGKPIIYMSATPHAQSLSMIYHQLALSDWSPFKESTFKKWFEKYGIPYLQYIGGRQIPKFDKTKDEEVYSAIGHLFISKTRKELGFEYEPIDKIHYIELDDKTKEVYNYVMKNKLYIAGEHKIVCKTVSKLRSALHMIEGGVSKVVTKSITADDTVQLKDNYIVLSNKEKIQYILDTWGDTEDIAIMYNYKAEKIKIEKHFKKAKILQGTSNAEGIDLSDIPTLIIYSQDYSVARHTQRRARQANKFRSEPITVHYLLVKKAISEQIYDAVCIKKTNYVDVLFERSKL